MAGKAQTPPNEVNLSRTRSRRPKAMAERAAAAQLAATAAAQAGAGAPGLGGRVFTLYGKPPAPAPADALELEDVAGGVAVDFYRRLAGGGADDQA